MHGSKGPEDVDNVGSGADWLGTAGPTSILTAAEPTMSMPTFHNYEPRIVPADDKRADRIFAAVVVQWLTMYEERCELRPLTERVVDAAAEQALR
jgi:hypothetical protein